MSATVGHVILLHHATPESEKASAFALQWLGWPVDTFVGRQGIHHKPVLTTQQQCSL